MPHHELHIPKLTAELVVSISDLLDPERFKIQELSRVQKKLLGLMLSKLGGLRTVKIPLVTLGPEGIFMQKVDLVNRPPIVVVSPVEEQLTVIPATNLRGWDVDFIVMQRSAMQDVVSVQYDQNYTGNIISVLHQGDPVGSVPVASLLPDPDGTASLRLGRRLTLQAAPGLVDPQVSFTVMLVDCAPCAAGFGGVEFINVCAP